MLTETLWYCGASRFDHSAVMTTGRGAALVALARALTQHDATVAAPVQAERKQQTTAQRVREPTDPLPTAKRPKEAPADSPGGVLERLGRELAAQARAMAAAEAKRSKPAAAAAASVPSNAQAFYGPPQPVLRARFYMPPNASVDEKLSLLQHDIDAAVMSATPDTTKRTYATYQNQFRQFCADKGLGEPTDTNMPLKIAAFILERSTGPKALAISTLNGPVRAALGAMVPYQDDRPTTKQVVKKALYAANRTAPNPKRAKEPIPTDVLVRVVTACWTAKTRVGTRDGALFTFMCFGVLRRSEAVALRKEHVTRRTIKGANGDEIQCIQIVVERAKNDPKREGSKRILPAASDSKSPLCPVGAYLRLMTIAGEHAQHAPLFFNLTDERQKRSAYHVRAQPNALKPATPNKRLKRWLANVGTDTALIDRLGSHSLRKAAATIAFAAGVPRLTIQRAGAWRSDAVDAYITVNEAEHVQCWREVVDNADDAISSDDDE